MTNNALAYVFTETELSTTSGSDLEHNKFVGPIPSAIRCLRSKDGDLLSRFDKINEETGTDAETIDNINSTSLKDMLITNQTTAVKKVRIKAELALGHSFGFCKTFKNVTEISVFI